MRIVICLLIFGSNEIRDSRRIQIDSFINFTTSVENCYCERLSVSDVGKLVSYTDETIGLVYRNFMGVAVLKSIMKGSRWDGSRREPRKL